MKARICDYEGCESWRPEYVDANDSGWWAWIETRFTDGWEADYCSSSHMAAGRQQFLLDAYAEVKAGT